MAPRYHFGWAYQHTARPIVAMGKDYASGQHVPKHSHRRAQLVFSVSGVMTVSSEDGRWTVPATRAIWVPAKVQHSIEMAGAVQMRTVYFEPREVTALPKSCAVVNVTSLLRELILEAVKVGTDYPASGRDARLMRLIVDEIRTLRQLPLQLQFPSDARALRVARRVLAEPENPMSVEEWARVAGVSSRTLARLFAAELGISFGRWCQQARLQQSLSMLAGGESVITVALSLGYESPSAFAYAFRKYFGVSPSGYFRTTP